MPNLAMLLASALQNNQILMSQNTGPVLNQSIWVTENTNVSDATYFRTGSKFSVFKVGTTPVGTQNNQSVNLGAGPNSFLSPIIRDAVIIAGSQTGFQSLLFPSGTSVSANIYNGSYALLTGGITAGSYDLSAGSINQTIFVQLINSGGSLTGSVTVGYKPTPVGIYTGYSQWQLIQTG